MNLCWTGKVEMFDACQTLSSRRVAVVCVEALGVGPGRAATGADLGGSSKYSNENFEGRSGEGFHVNSI